ncbi:MAG: hypothetical protein ABIJ18_04415 [archaeon]
MKLGAFIVVLLFFIVLVSASDCSDFCQAEDYDGGVCRAASTSQANICDEDETMYSFSYCADGSLERCCCYNNEEVDDVVEDEPVVEEVESESVGFNVDWGNVYIDKSDIPMIIFFELLIIVLILGLFLAFKKPKEKDEFL